ncbi:MAG: hypothetical protein JWN72_547 [Thermoleophilia bacterium]|nr:hypothetical protein [Thermoleophilia bacterium]
MAEIEALLPYLRRNRAEIASAERLLAAAGDGSDEELALAVTDALTFAGGELAEELRSEETFLLPQLAALDVAASDEVEIIAFDHLRLRVLHLELENEPHDRSRATAFATHLLAHSQWEEQELFPVWRERLVRLTAGSGPAPDPAAAPAPRTGDDDRPHLTLIEGGG